MVWVTGPTPSVLSEWVQARERDPSMELALVREAVLERTRRVILAEGTGKEEGEGETWGGIDDRAKYGRGDLRPPETHNQQDASEL
ncbi:unnamed protein product [Pleuronectes platessa]|uniref:Uncharacterized protein n=1 Tax=Pleuronectes platessa TaxID=8262 RepID=A0A9N7V8X4_PLEPL|nr:unnamed protein product [Pleuronectes platessa]